MLVKRPLRNHSDKLRTDAIRSCARDLGNASRGRWFRCWRFRGLAAQYFAFVAEGKNGKLVAHQKPLTVGDTVGNDYVVLDGVKAGDKVIVSGTQFLVDGMPVVPRL